MEVINVIKKQHYGSEVKCEEIEWTFPPQQQTRQPGFEYLMDPLPIFDNPKYIGTGKLKDRTAIITGGDSGIGRAVAVAFAKEGANIVISYFDEHTDAETTKRVVEHYGRSCLLIPGDLRRREHCEFIVQKTLETFGKIDILVNNAAVQFLREDLTSIPDEQWELTFDVNIHAYFHLTKAALPYLKEGASIVNTTSLVAYIGVSDLIDYTTTKGAIVSYTRALANNLVQKGIRVNAVAPGPFWTPIQPASQSAENIATLGSDVPMKRAGQPYEIAPVYVLLASDDGSYMTGQTIHVNGGAMVTT
ncbi:NAD(P)-dependent oxidoreductase [Niallia circulans]|jgi:NAD(P)-dependent dehydrogenase (short-subunit alcohol dehydrogenase family)|uniref:SDR family oxidoreductase n=1 Tax=Niallia TaxID=2837506 RepID=UPI000BA7552E|nr:SDR family oxidoreductase [Niallia circulans]MED5101274.1 SDR family oxidoreductase [Niallia circulans]PAE10511.1 NAD(P)-dependent oxidoreductase [Niallia circulans]